VKKQYPNLIAIDYTHPSATLENVQCYKDCQTDFIVGTTGWDPIKMLAILAVEPGLENQVTAVIAPNMGKQIVAMQAALLEMSNRFPGSFEGYKLEVIEELNHSTMLSKYFCR